MKEERKTGASPARGPGRTGRGGTQGPAGGASLYRVLFESAPDGMLIVSANTGRILETNPAFSELSGFSAEELRGRKLEEILPFQSTDAGLVVLKELRKQKRIYYDDLPFETRDRGRISVELACAVHETAGGKIIHCSVRDITDYQKMKQELWESEARFKALYRQAGIGIALLDRAGRFLEGNAQFCEMAGCPESGLAGLGFADIAYRGATSPPLFFQDVLEGAQTAMRAAQQCFRKDGSAFWALVTCSAIRGPGGAPPFFLLTMEDITERKRAEEALASSRNYYLSLISEVPNPIRISDTDARCDYVNKSWLEFTGRRLDEEIGEQWADRVHPEDRERVREMFILSFRNRAPYVTEYRLAHAGGSYRWVVEFGRPFNDIDGNFAGFISSCYDVHERKAFEDRLHSISFTDDLTGLLNRRGFFSLAQQQVKLANRTRKGFLFLYADLDGLKKINDSFGHQEGDLALVEAARVLREVFRESDIIARLGGDEFAVLMTENAGAGEERPVMQRLRECIAEHNARPDRRFALSLSTGTIRYDPLRPCALDELVTKADRLMYRDKKSKRAQTRR